MESMYANSEGLEETTLKVYRLYQTQRDLLGDSLLQEVKHSDTPDEITILTVKRSYTEKGFVYETPNGVRFLYPFGKMSFSPRKFDPRNYLVFLKEGKGFSLQGFPLET